MFFASLIHLPSRQRFGYCISARTPRPTCGFRIAGRRRNIFQCKFPNAISSLYGNSHLLQLGPGCANTWRLERRRLLISLCWSVSPLYSSPVLLLLLTGAMEHNGPHRAGVEAFQNVHDRLARTFHFHQSNNNNNNNTCIPWKREKKIVSNIQPPILRFHPHPAIACWWFVVKSATAAANAAAPRTVDDPPTAKAFSCAIRVHNAR